MSRLNNYTTAFQGQMPMAQPNDAAQNAPSEIEYEHTPQQLKKLNSLESSISKLQAQISKTESLLATAQTQFREVVSSQDPNIDANTIVHRHIKLLHDYNEIKDIGQGLMGMIADGRGVRYADVQNEFGIGSSD